MKRSGLFIIVLSIATLTYGQQQKNPPHPQIKLSDLFKKKSKPQSAQTSTGSSQNNGMGTVAPGDMAITDGILTSGEYCTVVLRQGVLYGWGDNSYGQSGVGKSQSNFTPVQITTDNDWKSVSMAEYHTLAIKTDGTLWAWGWGNSGELGLGWGNFRIEYPTRVGRDTDWVSVACSDGCTAAIKSNGTLWIWGNNADARLGIGPTPNGRCDAPHQFGRDRDWASVTPGDAFTMAIKKDGSLWAWGFNSAGCLGTPILTQVQQAAIQIGTDKDWAKVFTGWRGYASFGIKKDGTLWAWGSNRAYQLGLGKSTKNVERPTQVGTDNDWVSISNGGGYTLGLKKDGSIWQWGDKGFSGQAIVSPQRINIPGSWISISADMNHAVAIMNNGRVWAWGDNYYGQLGAGKSSRGAMSGAPAEVRDFPTPVITTKSKKELATVMNDETKVMFKNVRSKLAIKDKNAIAKLAGFQLSKDGKQFILGADAADYPFDVLVYPTDMNKDGVEEVFITFGNSYTSGLAGSSVLLFIRDTYGDWHKQLGFPGMTPDVLGTVNSGYPDLLIGGPGMSLPVWRWNGKEYVFSRNVANADVKKLHSVNAENLSKTYVNNTPTKK